MSETYGVNATIAVIVVAAGRGTRAGDGLPKQYRHIAGRALLSHTLRALQDAAPQATITVVIHQDDFSLYEAATLDLAQPLPAPVHGAASRQASVLAGLEALAAQPPDLVLIHDAARPFASPALVARAIAAAHAHRAAVPGLAVTDTIKVVDHLGLITGTPPRAQLRAVQTPQAFDFALILAAHRAAQSAGMDNCSDDAAIAEWAGHAVNVFAGDADNVKITTMEDFALADARLRAALTDIRTGQGYDVHAFGPGDHCEMPKIGPHRDVIRASIAAIMGIDIGRVAIKATTSERLGFTGRNEGMAAMALACLRLPEM